VSDQKRIEALENALRAATDTLLFVAGELGPIQRKGAIGVREACLKVLYEGDVPEWAR
jgi:hypothetical protein